MAKDTGVVDIRGKTYLTVAKRVQDFREKHKLEYAIVTEIVDRTADDVVMKATIQSIDGNVVATGYAEEKRTASQINRTSALENCETSAIGRALAAFGLAGSEYASADEVAAAMSQQQQATRPQAPKPQPQQAVAESEATPIQRRQIAAFLRALHIADEDMVGFVKEQHGYNLKDLSRADATQLLRELQ